MLPQHISQRVRNIAGAGNELTPFAEKYFGWVAAAVGPTSDFAFGNPHEMPLHGFVEAMAAQVEPQNKEWYAYKFSERPGQEVVAAALAKQTGRPYEPEDIFMTNGATGALYVTIQTFASYGDEVIYNSPPWFGYEGMIHNAGAVPVRVRVDPVTFDLDHDAIAAAITERTRLIIVNSPNNPTGKIYSPESLRTLGSILTGASQQYGRPIYLLSDEAYRKIRFDGREFPSPTSYYANSLVAYTYGKTLLTPGQRLGYIAVSPEIAERNAVRKALFVMQGNCGFAFASALMQHALPQLESLSIDMRTYA